MGLEFSRQIFEKSSNLKCNENSSGGSRVVPCGRTDRRETSSRVLQFCEHTQKCIKKLWSFTETNYFTVLPPSRSSKKVPEKFKIDSEKRLKW